MVDHAYEDGRLARLYDLFNTWGPGDEFYLGLVGDAGSVLDVGCGTGLLLHRAREAGHTGRLVGLDPARGMLGVARRRREDIEWVLGDAQSTDWDAEFDLTVMTGHAFQVLVTDDQLRTSLAAIRQALTPGGAFAFETRNPSAKAWERWTPERAAEVTDADGALVRAAHEVEHPVDVDPVDGGLVRFSTTCTGAGWAGPEVSRSTLRFLGQERLGEFLAEAGLEVAEQYGDWGRGPVTEASPEIITVARRA
ncbi:class I SAM-dependent methyltransferase [Streptomyces sp. NBC_01304]|uniref:class I SAM-dependent methyltransferase n=1 Tax=Streptomyces sp. NBC_01304 TaxID=2903818 RepID=UPI002E0FD06B|nr:class I SAM-dependent methyltransferase [Streptomyces sp. NBC_01304]